MSQDLVTAARTLADTIAVENQALATLNLQAAAKLLPLKEAATTAFNAAQKFARTTRAPIDAEALRDAAKRLDAVTEENRRLLERAIRVQNRVLGILANAARAADPTPRYGRSGAYAARPTSSWALTASA
jgi:hypothetical protein